MLTVAEATIHKTTIYLKENAGQEYGVYEFCNGKPEKAFQHMTLDHALRLFCAIVEDRSKELVRV